MCQTEDWKESLGGHQALMVDVIEAIGRNGCQVKMASSKDDIEHGTGVDNTIQIGVQDQNEEAIIHLKIKKSAPFKKLMNVFSTRQRVNIESLRFTFDGKRLRPTDCPNDHQMEDGDTLEVFHAWPPKGWYPSHG